MKIQVLISNVFDIPADILLVQSNIHKPCEKPTSLMSQTFTLAGEKFKKKFDFETKEGRLAYGDVLVMKPENLSDKFMTVCVGFPGTGNPESFDIMLKNLFSYGYGLAGNLKRRVSISAPPVGTNVGGLTLEEFMKGLNERFSMLKETGNYRRFETFSLAAKNQEQKELLEGLLEFHILEQ
jgi:hypothetical protein